MKVGVLALQGAVALHLEALRALGVAAVEVRTGAELDDVDAIVLPGGESTTMSKLLMSNELFEPLRHRLAGGLPVLGTCAGMILLSSSVLDGRSDQRSLGVIDIDVRRNAFGRQIDSFEASLTVRGLDDRPFPGVFIRAPFVERVGPEVEVLATIDGHPVACRQRSALVTAFHPELAADETGRPDRRVHQLLLDAI